LKKSIPESDFGLSYMYVYVYSKFYVFDVNHIQPSDSGPMSIGEHEHPQQSTHYSSYPLRVKENVVL